MLQFEYKDLPEELKSRSLLHRAKGEGLIISLGKNGNGRNLWRISDNVKCNDENSKKKIEDNEKIEDEEKVGRDNTKKIDENVIIDEKVIVNEYNT